MNLTIAKRILRAGFLDFWRNGFVSVSSVVIMVFTLFIIGFSMFASVVIGTDLQLLRDKADLNVYFVTDAPEDQVHALEKSVQALPEVASTSFTTQDEALAQFRNRHQNNQLTLQALDEVGGNPFGAVLTIRAKDINQYGTIAQFLEQQQAVAAGQTSIIDTVNYFVAQHHEAIDKIAAISAAAQRIGTIIVVILILITLAICFTTLRLAIYVSREEIGIMRLVGAGQFYIRAPFMVEGMLYGLTAGIITLLLFYPATYWLGDSTEHLFNLAGINVFSYYLSHFPLFFFVIIGTGVVLGALASYLAVRRYLKI